MATVDRYQYLLLMAGCLIVTLPLEFVFGARVWRRPLRLLIALAGVSKGDEASQPPSVKEPELRAELILRAKADQE